MQVLDSEQLEYAFQLHNITLEVEARKFYADLWATIQRAEKIEDIASLSLCSQELRRLCHHYFSLMGEWQEEERDRQEAAQSCASSRDNAREALSALPVFEKQFFRYVLCYLELNRALIRTREELSFFARGYDLDEHPHEMLQVGHNTGQLLDRAHKERKYLMEKRLRLGRAVDLLKSFEPLMTKLETALPRLPGHRKGDQALTLFKGSLRKEKFDQARTLVRGWGDADLRAAGYEIADIVQKNAAELRVRDGLMLHAGELGLIMASLKSDEARVNQFLEKFNVPYMVFQYKSLIHLGYLLGRIGSIEGLIIQHAKLVSLAARPHNDPGYAQVQEQAVLAPARVLLQNRFKMLSAIFDDMETMLTILDDLFTKTREYKAPLEN